MQSSGLDPCVCICVQIKKDREIYELITVVISGYFSFYFLMFYHAHGLCLVITIKSKKLKVSIVVILKPF